MKDIGARISRLEAIQRPQPALRLSKGERDEATRRGHAQAVADGRWPGMLASPLLDDRQRAAMAAYERAGR